MNLKEYLNNNIVYLDGGMGTMLQKSGLALGELPERLNITSPELITDIHSSYFAAGSQIISTNTFGANSLKFPLDELELIISKAVENAKRARDRFGAENGIKFKAVEKSFSRKTYYESLLIGHLEQIVVEHRYQKSLVAFFADSLECGKREHLLRKCLGCKLTKGGKHA